MIRVYREERDLWKRAFESAQNENREFQQKMEERFSALEQNISAERTAWKKEIRKSKAPGFGLFTGFGVDHRGEGNWVIGAGIVWKIW